MPSFERGGPACGAGPQPLTHGLRLMSGIRSRMEHSLLQLEVRLSPCLDLLSENKDSSGPKLRTNLRNLSLLTTGVPARDPSSARRASDSRIQQLRRISVVQMQEPQYVGVLVEVQESPGQQQWLCRPGTLHDGATDSFSEFSHHETLVQPVQEQHRSCDGHARKDGCYLQIWRQIR